MNLYIDIKYPIANQELFIIDTNVKESYLTDLLADYIHDQIGQGADQSKPVDKEEYHIRIEIDLSHDIFKTWSDTGNKGLTTGIIMDVLNRLLIKAKLISNST